MKKTFYKKIFKFFRNIFFILILKRFWINVYGYIQAKYICFKLKKTSIKNKKPVIIYVSHFDYYYSLIQRPNHIFNILSSRGYPCVVCCEKFFLTQPKENLFVIPNCCLKTVLSGNFEKVFDISLGFPYKDIKNINKYISNKTLILYELIDNFELLSNKKNITRAKQMFIELSKRDKTFIFVTAEHLKQVAIELGAKNKNIIDNKNGVILEDFTKAVEPDTIIQEIKNKGKPIIGYYGALTATWFDFDMILNLVKQHKEYEFVLIGLLYSDANLAKTEQYIKKLKKYDNFTYIPPVLYKDIPKYAKSWDVATIPFKINDITLSTNPVKMFEYMAMGLPIVTTAMPECKLYKSVFVAKDCSEFAKKISLALSKKDDKKYKELLYKEAKDNTWDSRVNDIVEIIKKYYKE